MRLFFLLFSSNSSNLKFKNKDSDALTTSLESDTTYIYEGEGVIYLRKTDSGLYRGYYEYGSFEDDNYVNAFLSVRKDYTAFYGIFLDLDEKSNLLNKDNILDRGTTSLTDSLLILNGGGTARWRNFVDFSYPVEFQLQQTTTDDFVVILKDHPVVLDEAHIPIKNIPLYRGMVLRSTQATNAYYTVNVDGKNLLLKVTDCREW